MKKQQEPIRILQCVSNMDRAGIETMLMNFYRNIDRDKIQFDFLCNKSKPGDYDEEIKALGGNIYVSPGLNPFKWFKYQKYMKELFKKHPEYKIIHCQNEAMGFPALYAAKKCGIPVRIAHSHNTVTRKDFKWPIKIAYKYLLRTVATDYVACSHAAGKYLFGKDVKVINNAIDSQKFIYNEEIRKKIRKKYNLEDKFVIGHVGRFEPQKNHEFLIKLFNEYQKKDSNAVLLLIGTGLLEEHIKELVKILNIQDKVIFTGSIPNVNEMYQAMDMFILPSFHEGLPVVGIEAQAASLKCIFADTITKEVNITDNVQFISLKELKKYWMKAIDDCRDYKRKNMQEALIKSNYDIKSATKELEKIYEKSYRLYQKGKML